MYPKTKPLLLFAFMVQSLTLQAQSVTTIKDFRWLEGSWKMKVRNGAVVEKWAYVNDSTMTQEAFFITDNGKRIPQESIELVSRKGAVLFISTVANQNDGKPITFRVTSFDATGFTSENPAHDYPQKISYLLQSPGKLLASIEGLRNGTFSRKEYPMSKED